MINLLTKLLSPLLYSEDTTGLLPRSTRGRLRDHVRPWMAWPIVLVLVI